MQENEEKVVKTGAEPTWDNVFEFMGNAAKIKAEGNLASETISRLEKENKRRNFDMAVLGAFATAVVIGLIIANCSHARANERNNQRWIEYLSQYDFVSQDGGGYNYYNSDVGGDVVNGAESPQEEEQE